MAPLRVLGAHVVRVAAEDAEGHKKLAGPVLRAPMSLEKRTDDDATGGVIDRSKRHAGLKRGWRAPSVGGRPAS